MAPQYDRALRDIRLGVANWRMWGRQGWSDVRARYRRTTFGPFWATVSLGIFMVSFSIVWSQLWNMNVREYLPFVAAGMLGWTLVSAIIVDGTTAFTSAEPLIKSLQFPLTVLTCAVVWRNVILFFHNLLVFVGIAIFCGIPLTWGTLLLVPALILIAINGVWVATLLGMVGARYRDMQQLITSILQIALFLTPIFWSPDQLKGRVATILVDYNPLLYYIQIIRGPLLGKAPAAYDWFMVLLATVAGWLLTLAIYARFRRRVAYWL
jgi:ABC-type polysaccharide/polyol phosphate export permease